MATTRSGFRTRSEDLAFLRALARSGGEDVRALLGAPGFDAPACDAFLRHHLLRPWAHAVLEQHGAAALLPARMDDGLRHVHAWWRRRNAALLERTATLCDALSGAAVEVLVMKGPLLARRWYGDLGQRSCADIDLLLRHPDLLRAADRALRAHGFERRALLLFGRAAARRFTHQIEYRDGDVAVDVHWTLRSHFSYRIDYEALWRRRQAVAAGGTTVPALSDEDALTLVALSAGTDLQHGKLRLRAFVDVLQALRRLDRGTDWGAFFEAHRRAGLLRILAAVLRLVFGLLDARAEAPRAVGALDTCDGGAPRYDEAEALALINGRDTTLRNRLWGMRLHEAPVWKSALWALAAAPVKAATYRRLPQALRAWR
jgi:hypothetical protein